MFDKDWERALESGVGKYILRVDDGAADEATNNEVHEVVAVLREFRDLLNAAFDFYAAQGSSSDITQMTANGFSMFTAELNLSDKNSKFCRGEDLDRLFIAVDVGSNKASEKFNRKKALNRQEFMRCVVNIACMKYVMPGDMVDVSDSLHCLCSEMDAKLDKRVFAEGNEFRTRFAYIEETDNVLRKYEKSLRLIYERTTKLRGQEASKGIANKLVSYLTWKDLMRTLGLIDTDLTDVKITLAFVWARMRVIDEQSDRGRALLTHHSFEDFLEALCRCSVCKAWPSPGEVDAGGTGNAGAHMIWLKNENPEAYAALLRERSVAWGGEPTQRIQTCVENMCVLLVSTCLEKQGKGKQELRPLTEKEVAIALPMQAGS